MHRLVIERVCGHALVCACAVVFFLTDSALYAVNYADQDGGAVHGGRGSYTAFELDELKDPT